jgi:hypothetical protein
MSATPIYLLAKYIPDLERFEPRNIGVVLWSQDGVEARFVGEKLDQPGEVDGRSVPGFITSLSAYKQWVKYWRVALSQSDYAPPAGGAKISRSTPGFMEALKTSGTGNFLLADGGVLLDDLAAEELPSVVNQLFDRLVESGPVEEPRDMTLDEMCDELMEESKLAQHPHFRTRYAVKCPINGVEEEYIFTHGLGNGKPECLLQTFPMPKRKADMRKSTHDTAWAFEKVQQAHIVTPEQTAALVLLGGDQSAEPEVDRVVRVLGSVTKVINVRDRTSTLAFFEELARLPVETDEHASS